MVDALLSRKKSLGVGTWIVYAAGWLDADEATSLQTALTEQVAWEQRAIKMFGKEIMQPRLIGWAGELPYRYSGQTLPPSPGPTALRPVWDRVNEELQLPFNHALLNRYRSGQDAMGYHADDEPELGYEPVTRRRRRGELVKPGVGATGYEKISRFPRPYRYGADGPRPRR